MWEAGIVVYSAVILRQRGALDPRFLRDSWALSYMTMKTESVGQNMTTFSGFSALGIQQC